MTVECPKCQTENPDTKKFCGDCGTPLEADVIHTKTLETPKEELTRGSVFANRYEIIEELGKGGMGRVYRVEDKKTKEEIALKLIKPDIAADKKTIERFRNELTTARKIAHRNVCRMFDLGEEKSQHYITMEYVPGGDLKRLIRRTKQLTVGTAISISKQICEGLAEAHNLGVVHRDLKPSNIMIDDDGNVRIMDFGIARTVKGKGITGSGVMIGTPEYMSPEQVEAKDIDRRSDIYSLGIIMYEMLTGRLPFEADTPFAVGVKHKSEIPKDPKELNPQIPFNLSGVILKCLQKEKERRYQNAGEVRSDLENIEKGLPTSDRIVQKQRPKTSKEVTVTFGRRWIMIVSLFVIIILAGLAILFLIKKEGSLLQDEKKIVILPFENQGPQEDESLANGLALAIMTRLNNITGLVVIDQSSAFQYKDTDKSIQEIAGELGVDYILKGTVRWQRKSDGSGQIRVTPRLINASDATQRWAEEYTEEINDSFQVESDIARQVVEALDIIILEPERLALEEKHTENNEAYQAYLIGLDYEQRPDFSEEILQMRVQMFERAVEIDPSFALAHAALARAHSRIYHEGFDRSEKRLAMAKAAVDHASALDPDLNEAHMALGYYYYHGKKDYTRALEQFMIALEKEPENSEILSAVGYVQRRQNMFELALENHKKSFSINPRNVQHATDIGTTSMYFRNYAEAERYYNLSISLGPDQLMSYIYKAQTFWLWKGDTDKARAALEDNPQRSAPLSIYYWFHQEMYERDYAAAIEWLFSYPDEFFKWEWYIIPRAQLAGHVYELMDESELARASYESALALLEKYTQEQEDDPRIHSSLGIVFAGLGRKEEAISEGELGVELYPVSNDTLVAPHLEQDLAQIYTMVGEYDAAIDKLEYLLSIPSFISVAILKIDPLWDPLRQLPKFQQLLEKYPKNN